jgi:hypothetical protein
MDESYLSAFDFPKDDYRLLLRESTSTDVEQEERHRHVMAPDPQANAFTVTLRK